jgi:hypothetical protein
MWIGRGKPTIIGRFRFVMPICNNVAERKLQISRLSIRHVRWIAGSSYTPMTFLIGAEPAGIFVSGDGGKTYIGVIYAQYGLTRPIRNI